MIIAHHVQRHIEKVRAEAGNFYVTTALINIGLGIATTLVMMAWGMPTPYLWGALAATVNFIPYAGSDRPTTIGGEVNPLLIF